MRIDAGLRASGPQNTRQNVSHPSFVLKYSFFTITPLPDRQRHRYRHDHRRLWHVGENPDARRVKDHFSSIVKEQQDLLLFYPDHCHKTQGGTRPVISDQLFVRPSMRGLIEKRLSDKLRSARNDRMDTIMYHRTLRRSSFFLGCFHIFFVIRAFGCPAEARTQRGDGRGEMGDRSLRSLGQWTQKNREKSPSYRLLRPRRPPDICRFSVPDDKVPFVLAVAAHLWTMGTPHRCDRPD